VVDVTGKFSWAFFAAAVVAAIRLFCWLVVIPRIEPLEWADEPG